MWNEFLFEFCFVDLGIESVIFLDISVFLECYRDRFLLVKFYLFDPECDVSFLLDFRLSKVFFEVEVPPELELTFYPLMNADGTLCPS